MRASRDEDGLDRTGGGISTKCSSPSNGRQLYVWRAVDGEGEVLDLLIQPRRDRKAALKLMRKLLKKQGVTPATIVTDKLGSYSSARRELGVARRHDIGPLAE